MTTTAAYGYASCKCCGGSGVQTRNDGIKIRCPACGGSGKWQIDVVMPYYPVPAYQVYPEWPSYPTITCQTQSAHSEGKTIWAF